MSVVISILMKTEQARRVVEGEGGFPRLIFRHSLDVSLLYNCTVNLATMPNKAQKQS
jgi:hypothetical protein